MVVVLGLSIALSAGIFARPAAANDAPRIERARLPDGVELWTRIDPEDARPHFFRRLEEMFELLLPRHRPLPFGESVAFLVGASAYRHIEPQLPFVRNDLRELREFLLGQGGFDRVYVALDETATRDRIEDYMANRFRRSLSEDDRLLFYYAGHGADFGGTTGYMQLSLARPDDFAHHVLPIQQCIQWSRFIPARHVVFIFDSCASGLAFTPRSAGSDSYEELAATLSGNGSRTVITAGTANEKSYEIRGPGGRGNGVFTRAFLDAMTSRTESGRDGFLTLHEIFARAEIGIRRFAAAYGKSITPRMWQLEEDRYRGTFVFLDPALRGAPLPGDIARLLDAGFHSSPRALAEGGISVVSDVWTRVSLEGFRTAETPAFFSGVPAGVHRIRASRPGYREQIVEVRVQEGRTAIVKLKMERSAPLP